MILKFKLMAGVAPIRPASHHSIQSFAEASQAVVGAVLRYSKCVILEIVTPIQSTVHHLNQALLEANQVSHLGLLLYHSSPARQTTHHVGRV
jgi:hypothetical protein